MAEIVGAFLALKIEWQIFIAGLLAGAIGWAINTLVTRKWAGPNSNAPGEEHRNETESLPDQTGLANTADLHDLLEKAVGLLIEKTSTDYNQLFLVSTTSHSKELVCVARHVAAGKQDYRIAAFVGLLGKAFESGRVVNVRDVRQRENYMQAVLQTKSELVVPIRIEGRVVGLINSESPNVGHFSSQMEAAVAEIARSVSFNLYRVGWSEHLSRDELPWINVSC